MMNIQSFFRRGHSGCCLSDLLGVEEHSDGEYADEQGVEVTV